MENKCDCHRWHINSVGVEKKRDCSYIGFFKIFICRVNERVHHVKDLGALINWIQLFIYRVVCQPTLNTDHELLVFHFFFFYLQYSPKITPSYDTTTLISEYCNHQRSNRIKSFRVIHKTIYYAVHPRTTIILI